MAVTHNSRLPTQQLSRVVPLNLNAFGLGWLGCLTIKAACDGVRYTMVHRTNDSFGAARSESGEGTLQVANIKSGRVAFRSTTFSSVRDLTTLLRVRQVRLRRPVQGRFVDGGTASELATQCGMCAWRMADIRLPVRCGVVGRSLLPACESRSKAGEGVRIYAYVVVSPEDSYWMMGMSIYKVWILFAFVMTSFLFFFLSSSTS